MAVCHSRYNPEFSEYSASNPAISKHSFNHRANICCVFPMPGTVLGVGNTAMGKTRDNPSKQILMQFTV